MTYLLDTNPCIQYLNGRSEALRRRFDLVGDSEIAVCSIVCAELFYGAAKSQAPTKTLQLQCDFLSRFRSIPFDVAAAHVYGPLRAKLEQAGATIGANDLLIASIALANGLRLVTHNTREFARIPDLLIDDWEIE